MTERAATSVFLFLAVAAALAQSTPTVYRATREAEVRRSLVEVQKKHVDWLLEHPDVTAVDVNYRTVRGQPTDELGLVVWVKKKLPESEVLTERRIPREIDGARTDIVEGEFTLLQVSYYNIMASNQCMVT